MSYVDETEYTKVDDRHFVKLEIVADEDACNPRKEWDNVGTMVCFHSRYDLGDEHGYKDASAFLEELASEVIGDKSEEYFEDMHEEIYEEVGSDRSLREYHSALLEIIDKRFVILPLFLYDHSGLTMNTSGFSCNWDSGQVGWIYCSKEKAVSEWGKKNFTRDVRQKAEKYLTGEVETFDQYLTGDVWGYRAELFELDEGVTFESMEEDGLDESDWTDNASEVEEDSCWGFFGSEYCLEEGRRVVEHFTKKAA